MPYDASTKNAEDLVRSVLSKTFNQKVDADTLRSVAEKVAKTIPAPTKKESV